MFNVIALEDCPYSIEAVNTLKHLKPKITWVKHENKHKYKTAERSTFPQISYTVKTKKGHKDIYIGGLSDLEYLLDTVKQLKSKNYNAQIVVPMLALF